MSYRTLLVSDASNIRLNLDNVVINKNQEEIYVPLRDILIIVVDGMTTTISTRLLSKLANYNIALVICDDTKTPNGLYTGFNTHSRASKLLKSQIMWSDEYKDCMWQKIVRTKLSNQLKNIIINKDKIADKDYMQENIELIQQYIEQVVPGDTTVREAVGAKVYFYTLFGKGFKRDRNSDDIVNCSLNYGYSIVRAYMARLCVAYGLVPMIGVHHKNEYNSYNLVDDLIEPFRPIVDYVVYNFIKDEKYFRKGHKEILIQSMNDTIKYNNKRMTVVNAMEAYVIAFTKSCENIDIVEMPDLSTFEYEDNEEE